VPCQCACLRIDHASVVQTVCTGAGFAISAISTIRSHPLLVLIDDSEDWQSICERNRADGAVRLKTILLVEDSRFLCLANERVLVRVGYEVISVPDGEAAVQMARKHLPDLILLDMMLPKLEGVAVLRALRKEPLTASIPVIVLTSLAQKNAARLLQEGAVAYFEKSDLMLEKGSESLIRVVESVLGKMTKCESRA
jgi:twitching motility two-component system response regulator PilH